jgi:hypothetical protein
MTKEKAKKEEDELCVVLWELASDKTALVMT